MLVGVVVLVLVLVVCLALSWLASVPPTLAGEDEDVYRWPERVDVVFGFDGGWVSPGGIDSPGGDGVGDGESGLIDDAASVAERVAD